MASVRRGARWALLLFTGLFLLGVVLQFLLAGFALFGETSWEAHDDLGNMVVPLLSLLVLLTAVFAWAGRTFVVLGALIFVLTVVQVALPRADSGWISGLHPLNALVLFALAHALIRRVRPLVTARALPPPR